MRKHKRKWSWRTIFAVFGLAVCMVWFVWVVEALPIDWNCGGCLSDPVDSQALVLQYMNGTAIDTFGPRTNTPQCYETTLTSLVAESSYQAIQLIWDNSDTAAHWEFWYWGSATATISQANMAEIADSVDADLTADHGAGAWTTGTGSGDNDIRIYAIDTSGTDDSVMGVQITVKTIAGVYDIALPTKSNGYRDFTLPTDSMKYLGRRVGYVWITDTINVTGDDTVDIYGYNIPLQPSPDPNLCRVQGYVFVPSGATDDMIEVTFTNDGGVYNSCDSTAFINEPTIVWTSTHEDSLGFFYADLLPSGCLLKESDGDSLKYAINASLNGNTIKEKLFYVPQSESYEIIW